jgi:hypothetical protein
MVERKWISSDGVVDRIGKSAWSVGENGVMSSHRNGGCVEKDDGTCPRQINVGRND